MAAFLWAPLSANPNNGTHKTHTQKQTRTRADTHQMFSRHQLEKRLAFENLQLAKSPEARGRMAQSAHGVYLFLCVLAGFRERANG